MQAIRRAVRRLAGSRRRSPRRIVVTGDVLRPTDTRFVSSQSKNTLWLFSLLRAQLTQAAAVPVETVLWDRGFATGDFYVAAGASLSLDGWATLYAADSLSVEAIAIVNEAFHDAFVVAFELPPVLAVTLTMLGIPWVDLSIHPIRFLPDLLIAFATNDTDVLAEAVPAHQRFNAFEPWAGLLMASAGRRRQPRFPDGSALAVGQVAEDRSVIVGGRFVDFAAYAPVLQGIAKANPIVFRPHPYGASDFGLIGAGLEYSRIIRTAEPLYSLLSHSAIGEVVTVSSSVGIEAPLFGKHVRWLGRSPFRIAPLSADVRPDSHLSLGHVVLQTDFWRQALRPYFHTTRLDRETIAFPPNTLRMSLRNFWGYNALTTDSLFEAWREDHFARTP